MPYRLLDPNGKEHTSDEPGTLGGYRPRKIYGRLDCRSAAQAIARGGYIRHRVFFADEETAVAAGYRPCGKCCPEKYKAWKAARLAAAARGCIER
jgi:methylphosphotriester-DNA--protein-cysteine methyltransferase